jgi:hypothetical protein
LTAGLACRQLSKIVRWLLARGHHLPSSFALLHRHGLYDTTAGGDYSTAMGQLAQKPADTASTAMGNYTFASTEYSTAMGENTSATGSYSTTVGEGSDSNNRLINDIERSFMVGYMSGETDTEPEFFVKEGAVGFGTKTPTEQVTITTPSQTDTKVLFTEDAAPAVSLFYEGSAGSSTNNLFHVRSEISGNERNIMTWKLNGNVGIGTTNPGKKLYVNGSAGGTQAWNASDGREKTEIKPIDNALEKILELRGISYRWKEGDEHESHGFDNKIHFGVIAQEVEAVYPQLVDNPGITEKRKHVEYNGLVGVLIEAVKELKAQNEKQRVANEKQQAEIEELRLMIAEMKG